MNCDEETENISIQPKYLDIQRGEHKHHDDKWPGPEK